MKNESYRDRVKRLNKQLLGEASRFIAEEDTEYQEFFSAALEKFGVSSPDELEGDKQKEFYDYVDQNWDAGENETDVDEADIKTPNKKDKPKIVDPGQQDIRKVDEAPDSPGLEDVEDNVDDTPDEESAIREMIRKEIQSLFEGKRIDPAKASKSQLKKWNKTHPMALIDGQWFSWDDYDGIGLVWVSDQDGEGKEVRLRDIDFVEE